MVSTAKKLDKVVGSMGVGSEVSRKRAEQGMDFLLCSLDCSALVRGFKLDIEDARKGVSAAGTRHKDERL